MNHEQEVQISTRFYVSKKYVKNIFFLKVCTHPLAPAASSVLVHEVLGCILHECAATQVPGNEDHEDCQRAGLVLVNSYQSVG